MQIATAWSTRVATKEALEEAVSGIRGAMEEPPDFVVCQFTEQHAAQEMVRFLAQEWPQSALHGSTTCRARLREHDVLARLGGEEFAVLLPETELYEARQVAEELRKEIASAQLVSCLAPGQVTMSLGVCELGDKETALAEMLKRADRALYSAKQGGRNLVCSL